jgi:hypothetical protein
MTKRKDERATHRSRRETKGKTAGGWPRIAGPAPHCRPLLREFASSRQEKWTACGLTSDYDTSRVSEKRKPSCDGFTLSWHAAL